MSAILSTFLRRAGCAALLLGTLAGARAADPAPSTPAPATAAGQSATDPSYQIADGDSVNVSVYGEPDLNASQRLDSSGKIRLPLLGDIVLSGKSVREAEHTLEQLYKERELLRDPLVSIVVSNFAVREVSVIGAVRSPGNFEFPRETTSIDIVDLITRLGGFLPTAKADMVKVTRRDDRGNEKIMTVDVESMISGRRGADSFSVLPGDRVWVPERLF